MTHTYGYMILVYDFDLTYYKPISDENPWYFSKTVALQRISQLEINEQHNPIKENDKYILNKYLLAKVIR